MRRTNEDRVAVPMTITEAEADIVGMPPAMWAKAMRNAAALFGGQPFQSQQDGAQGGDAVADMYHLRCHACGYHVVGNTPDVLQSACPRCAIAPQATRDERLQEPLLVWANRIAVQFSAMGEGYDATNMRRLIAAITDLGDIDRAWEARLTAMEDYAQRCTQSNTEAERDNDTLRRKVAELEAALAEMREMYMGANQELADCPIKEVAAHSERQRRELHMLNRALARAHRRIRKLRTAMPGRVRLMIDYTDGYRIKDDGTIAIWRTLSAAEAQAAVDRWRQTHSGTPHIVWEGPR